LTTRIIVLALAMLAMAGCSLFRHAPQQPTSRPHYVVGDPYQAGGAWYYPREMSIYEATGLATVAAAHSGLTADGEVFDPTALAAAHQTLQLPAIAHVTNMANGRQILVRLNDRGPANPARLIALTQHAADLLGASDGTPVRVQLDEGMTRTLADQLGGGPHIAMATAPRGAVQAESLAPPPGVRQSTRGEFAPGATPVSTVPAAGPAVPDRLPNRVMQGAPEPGQLYIRASEFGRMEYAQQLSAQLTGLNPQVERLRDGKTETYRVRAGPFASVAAADAALDQARRAGVIDAHIVVE
jgi:rare lipoprotein A